MKGQEGGSWLSPLAALLRQNKAVELNIANWGKLVKIHVIATKGAFGCVNGSWHGFHPQ